MTLARFSLLASAVVFGGFGLVLLVAPELLRAAGVEAVSPSGVVELRAFYGGLELGLAAFFALAAVRRDWIPPGLVVQVAALGGVVVGRLIGLLASGFQLRHQDHTAEAGQHVEQGKPEAHGGADRARLDGARRASCVGRAR